MERDSAQEQYDKMTKTPVHQLVLRLGLPTTVSMLVTSIYNMADTFFVSQLGTSVSGATGVVFALMAIINAFGFMFGHGAGSNISRKLGAHDVESARVFASTSFFLSLLAGSAIGVLGFLFHAPFMRLLGSTDSILPYAIEYSTWILIAAPAMASSCVMNNILRYEGKAFFAMLGLASGGILNIFGDMLLIFGLDLGVRGAGISTAVSQYISMAILISPFLRRKVQSRIHIRYVTRSFADIKNIIATGFPSLMRQGLNSISVIDLKPVLRSVWRCSHRGHEHCNPHHHVPVLHCTRYRTGLPAGQRLQLRCKKIQPRAGGLLVQHPEQPDRHEHFSTDRYRILCSHRAYVPG